MIHQSAVIFFLSLSFVATATSAFTIGTSTTKNGIPRCHSSSQTCSSPLFMSSEAETTTTAATEEEASPSAKKVVERERHTIFVGNLPFETTNQEIKDLFEQYGRVDLVALPKNKETDQPRGFAFVDMGTPEELDAAISGIDGVMFGSRKLRATKSAPQDGSAPADKSNARGPRSNNRKGGENNDNNASASRKIYVGNLPFDASKEELVTMYGSYGTVEEVYIPQNVETGMGRGFAFVTMESEDSLANAIEQTNGSEFNGRTLVVNKPLPPGEKAPARARAGGPSGGNSRSNNAGGASRTKLYIGNLSFYTVPETLKEIFEEFGAVFDCYLPEDPGTGGTRGFGFITMGRDDAMNAISELDGCEVDGRVIRVNEAKPKGKSNDMSNEEEGVISSSWEADE